MLGAADRWRLNKWVEKRNDDTLEELRRRGGFDCSLTTIWRALRRRGQTRKTKSQHADESGVNTAMARAYGWAPRGERAVGSAPGPWESFSVIAALGLDGVRAPLVLSGAVDLAAFDSYVQQVLVPELRRGDVVVWDSLPSHQGHDAAAAVRRTGARLMLLSPYSPGYTPIERLWSKVKAYLALGEALESVTPQDIIGWFEHAELCATHQ